ncbi:MAG: hypothetical protein F9K36_18455, partial [Burkholderiaceae bacterium]
MQDPRAFLRALFDAAVARAQPAQVMPAFLPTPPEIDVFERDWQNKGGYANFFELLPPDRYRQAHPEWYA